MDKLKKCPFCGNSESHGMGIRAGTESVYCRCGCLKPAQGWNARPIEDALQAQIAALEAEKKWHPVREILPEWYHPVLVFCGGDVKIAHLEMNDFLRWYETAYNNEEKLPEQLVTHWRELPAPPEEV